MAWAIEAFRTGRDQAALKHAALPGAPADHAIGGRLFVPPWSVDAVLNEKLVLGGAGGQPVRRLDLKAWGSIAKLLGTYNALANVESVKDIEDNKIVAALPRLFWPQYDWQIGYDNMFRLARAWHVYVTPEAREVFEAKYDIELDLFMKVVLAIYAGTEDSPGVSYARIEGVGASRAEIASVSRVIGSNFEGQMRYSVELRDSDLPRVFRRSVIKERPLFEYLARDGSKGFFVPSRECLLLRITDGLYYDIVSDPDARRVSGDKFEDLCFQLLEHFAGPENYVERERETSYGKSADLFLLDRNGEAGITVECKIRRIPQRVLTSPDPWRDCADAFDDIVKGIVQIWRTQAELYAISRPEMVGVVLQYDPWTVMGNAFIQEIFVKAGDKADRLGIPKARRIPVALVGYAEFESCLRWYEIDAIREGIRLSVEEKYHGYQLSGIIEGFAAKSGPKDTFDYSEIAGRAVPWWGELA
ncbi:hypothetical protein IQ782_15615 [Salipiger pacificus]|uniref:Restriction endonuclease n=2 Tax=Salipiger mangrovisoli TaxID=2865933 RepID=A0ABR9X446_9RHOB|nr:hypothetical protein [Salipiger mangrovisoli]